jgi:hypothetical protein
VNGRNVLGQAGPRFVRFVDGLPVSGVMFFDTYDLDFLDQRGLFDEVIEHEMGHVLGIGTLWNLRAPFPVRMLRQGPVADYAFVGKFANIHWHAEGGEGLLPIANVGAAGSIGSHWRESALRNELMTPSINSGVDNPLSRITAASLRDLGYGVGIVGEKYDLLRGTPGAADPNAEAAARAADHGRGRARHRRGRGPAGADRRGDAAVGTTRHRTTARRPAGEDPGRASSRSGHGRRAGRRWRALLLVCVPPDC